MSPHEEETPLRFQPRPSTNVTIGIPVDTLAALERIATLREMPVEALIKLYLGQGLRSDLAQRFADQVLDLTAQVLARHGQSQEQVEAIVREIRQAAGS
jgi:hypothetical protein